MNRYEVLRQMLELTEQGCLTMAEAKVLRDVIEDVCEKGVELPFPDAVISQVTLRFAFTGGCICAKCKAEKARRGDR